jgi:hypothetical protein
MTDKTAQQDELERIETMTILEAVAYANRLSKRLSSDDCVGKERQNVLELLRRLAVRVQFLNISLGPDHSKAVSTH